MLKYFKTWVALGVIVFALVAGSFAWMRNSFGASDMQLTSVAGHLPNLKFNLIADNGKPVTQANYQGKVALLFFGFTSCPDECPTTMMRLTNVLKQLGEDADHTQVLFVTVDPATDKPPVLQSYMKNFDSAHMTGLTGSDAQIEALAKRYRAAYQSRGPSGKDDDIVHSNAIYIFDSNGHAELLATPTDSDKDLVHDLHNLTEVSGTWNP